MGGLTDKQVKGLEAPEQGNTLVWDGELRGFGVCVTSAGKKSFVLDYRANGRKRRYTIGRYPEWTADAAHDEAVELRRRIRDGFDPLEEKHRLKHETTMDELCTVYLHSAQFLRKRESSQRDDRSMIERTIRPKLGKLRVAAVSERDIGTLHFNMNATPYAANRTLSLLSVLFEFGKKDKLLTDNPVLGVKRFKEKKRGQWMTVEQMQALDEALDQYAKTNLSAANALRLMILTGARMGEVLKAVWSEFDLEPGRGSWAKPADHTKQKTDESIPLNQPAIELLLSMKPHSARGPLFPGTLRKGRGGQTIGGVTRVSLSRPWVQVCKAAGLVEVTETPGKRVGSDGKPRMIKRYKPTVRRHDLRHNFASYLASSGVSLQTVGRLLGHKQASTTERYADLYQDALRTATNKMGDVIPFKSRKAV